MPAFLLGLSLIYTAALVVGLLTEPAVRLDNPWVLSMILVMWPLPILAAWATAESVRLLRGPRLRCFNRAHSWWLARLTRGTIAGLLGLAASLAALVYWSRPPGDVVVMALGGSLGTAVVLLFGRRIRPDSCVGCGYDLRGLTPASHGKCPECGADVNPNMPLPVTAAES
jgi:hypothetical protein